MTVEPLDVLYFLILVGGLIAAFLVLIGRGRDPIRLVGGALLAVLLYLLVQFLDTLF